MAFVYGGKLLDQAKLCVLIVVSGLIVARGTGQSLMGFQ